MIQNWWGGIGVLRETDDDNIMPTILYIRGWRLFFYTNERNEPPHIHARKGDAECKYWLHKSTFDIEMVYEYNMNPAERRTIRQIIFEHFDYLVSEYEALHRRMEE